MNAIYIKKDEWQELPPLAATIGFFDGVHRGHQFLIGHVVREAQAAGLAAAVITFDRHPRQVLQSDYQPQLLSTLDEKLMLLSRTQLDAALVLHFDKGLAALPARDFMAQVLRGQLNVRKLIIGYDNRFGHNRSEGFDDYVSYGRELGIEVIHDEPFLPDGEKISSSVIRRHIEKGDMEAANRALGYDYTLLGTVVSGYQNGHKIGFPTANLDVASCQQLIPAPGVYAVRVRQENSVEWKRGMMNIGTRPTFSGTALSLEVNIFNFKEDVYGQRLLVSIISKMRDERRFGSLDALARQLSQDKEAINSLLDARKDGVGMIISNQ